MATRYSMLLGKSSKTPLQKVYDQIYYGGKSSVVDEQGKPLSLTQMKPPQAPQPPPKRVIKEGVEIKDRETIIKKGGTE